MDTFTEKNWSNMTRPIALEIDSEVTTDRYGKFMAKPLERGYGQTLGNSLRRVLLSSLQGAGIVAMRIDGVEHEFDVINNIKQEVSEIILNLKESRFKLHRKEEVTLLLEKSKEGHIYLSDFETKEDVEILNPSHVIANISSGGSIRMEIKIARGKGYVTALDNSENYELPIGWIYLDTLFSPIQRVNFTITNSRVGRKTDFDKLTLEVWTNEGIDPYDAVAYSAKILRDQLLIFLNFKDEEEIKRVEIRKPQKTEFESNLALTKPVSELELSVRSANCLQNAEIKFIHELVSKTEGEMLRTKNFGRKSLNEIKEILTKMGLNLGMKVDSILKENAKKDESNET